MAGGRTVACAGALACAMLGAADGAGIRGRFAERGSERGIPGAAIRVSGEAAGRTDAAGHFVIEPPAAGAPWGVLAAGESAIGWVERPAALVLPRTELWIEPAPSGALVLEADVPAALAGSRVEVAALPEFGPDGLLPRTFDEAFYDVALAPHLVRELDPEGRARFDLLPLPAAGGTARYRVAARAESGAIEEWGGITVAAGGTATVRLDFAPLAARGFSVRVVDAAGVPRPGARVGGRAADGDGRVVFEAVPSAGEKRVLVVECEGDPPTLFHCERLRPDGGGAGAGASEPEAVLRRPGRLLGTCIDEAGLPVSGVHIAARPAAAARAAAAPRLSWTRSCDGAAAVLVRWWSEAPLFSVPAFATSDARGAFELRVPEDLDVELTIAGGAVPPRIARAGQDGLSILLPSARACAAVEVRLDGRTSDEIALSARARGVGEWQGAVRALALDGGAGFVRGHLPRGTWWLEVVSADQVLAAIPAVIGDEVARLDLALQLPDWGLARIAPRHPDGHFGLRVSAGLGGIRRSFGGPVGDPADAAGAGEVLLLKAGEAEIIAVGRGRAGRARTLVPAGATVDVVLAVEPSARLRLDPAWRAFGSDVALEVRESEQAWLEVEAFGAAPAEILPGPLEWRVRAGTTVVGTGHSDAVPGVELELPCPAR